MKTKKMNTKEKRWVRAFKPLINLVTEILDEAFEETTRAKEYRKFLNQVSEVNKQYHQKFMKAVGAR